MSKTEVAIISSGNIGTYLMIKISQEDMIVDIALDMARCAGVE